MDQRSTPLLQFDSDTDHSGRGGTSTKQVAVTAFVVALCAISTGAALALPLIWASTSRLLDFSVYMMGAHHLTDPHLYMTLLSTPPKLPFTYPPFAALAFKPLSWLPLRLAGFLWTSLSVFSLFTVLLLTIRVLRPSLDRRSTVVWSLALLGPACAMEPARLTLSYGQVNLVLAALVLGDLTGQLKIAGRPVPRGVLLGVAAAVKLTPLVFVPYLFLIRQRRSAGVATATFAACSAVTFLISPTASWQYWTKYVTDAKRAGGVSYISNQNLRGSLDRLFHHLFNNGVLTTVEGLFLVAGIALAYWAWRSSSTFLGIMVCAATGLLVSPITWAHHMVWVIPIILWLLWGSDRPAHGWSWALGAATLFWWAPIWGVPNGSERALHLRGIQELTGNSFFFATVLFLASVGVMLWWRQRRPVEVLGELPTEVGFSGG